MEYIVIRMQPFVHETDVCWMLCPHQLGSHLRVVSKSDAIGLRQDAARLFSGPPVAYRFRHDGEVGEPADGMDVDR